mmetsp:Transcript_21748/g.43148  ORF Transcript_21748/g.43148 Transcript_21748/m.43148 type:complete len:92 (+) Transcript_21748:801-1076(+)
MSLLSASSNSVCGSAFRFSACFLLAGLVWAGLEAQEGLDDDDDDDFDDDDDDDDDDDGLEVVEAIFLVLAGSLLPVSAVFSRSRIIFNALP